MNIVVTPIPSALVPRRTDSRQAPPQAQQPAGNPSYSPVVASVQADKAGAGDPPPSSAPAGPWTNEDKAKVRDLAALGLSASKIAAEFEGRSRNSIIGLVHRIGVRLGNPVGFAEGNSKGKPNPKKSISIAAQRKKNVRGGMPKKVLSIVRNGANVEQGHVDRSASRAGHAGQDQKNALAGQVETRSSEKLIDENASLAAREGEQAAAPIPRMVPLLDLKASDCRWPVEGEKEHTLFCGHRRASGSYCRFHAALVYVPLPIRRKAA